MYTGRMLGMGTAVVDLVVVVVATVAAATMVVAEAVVVEVVVSAATPLRARAPGARQNCTELVTVCRAY